MMKLLLKFSQMKRNRRIARNGFCEWFIDSKTRRANAFKEWTRNKQHKSELGPHFLSSLEISHIAE